MQTIVVSQRIDAFPTRNEVRDGLDQRLTRFLSAARALAVPLPNALAPRLLSAWLKRIRPSGAVLSGGNDIGEWDERDSTETYLLNWMEERKLPVLGLCRGMQMLACHANGRLRPVEGHVATRHRLRGAMNHVVNSYHAQGLAECPHGWWIKASSPDGCIEAIRNHTLPWEGWMWHPERETDFNANDLMALQALFH